MADSQKWGCVSEFLSYKVFSSRKSKHNIRSSGLWNHSTKDTSQRGILSCFIDEVVFTDLVFLVDVKATLGILSTSRSLSKLRRF